jgi:hypothetical protein
MKSEITTKSSGNYTYNDLSYYLNKNAQKKAVDKFQTAQNPYFDFRRSINSSALQVNVSSTQSKKRMDTQPRSKSPVVQDDIF